MNGVFNLYGKQWWFNWYIIARTVAQLIKVAHYDKRTIIKPDWWLPEQRYPGHRIRKPVRSLWNSLKLTGKVRSFAWDWLEPVSMTYEGYPANILYISRSRTTGRYPIETQPNTDGYTHGEYA